MTIADLDTYVAAQGPKIFADMLVNSGGETNYDVGSGSFALARMWANAHLFAEAQWYVEKVAEQVSPTKADLLIGQLEWEYGVIPPPGATILERQTELAWVAKSSGGATRGNIESLLTAALGADFVAFVTTSVADMIRPDTREDNHPLDPPPYYRQNGQWDAPKSLPGVFELTHGSSRGIVSGDPASKPIRLRSLLGDAQISNGQKVLFDVGDYARTESLQVTVISSPANNTAHPGEYLLVAQPLFPHSKGSLAQVGRVPNLPSTKRHNYVVLTAAAAVDATKRGKVNRIMRRLMRGVSTWDIVPENSSGSGDSGPFTIGSSLIDVTPIQGITY